MTLPIASARNNALAALNFLDHQPPDLAVVRKALGCLVGDLDRAGDTIDRIREHMKNAPPRNERFDLNAAIDEVIALARKHEFSSDGSSDVKSRALAIFSGAAAEFSWLRPEAAATDRTDPARCQASGRGARSE
jgi:hypothetical protein